MDKANKAHFQFCVPEHKHTFCITWNIYNFGHTDLHTFDTMLSQIMAKGQLISKTNCQAEDFSKKRTNEFVFTTMQRFFVCFLEEIEDIKKPF